jgi:hypothetical protein
MNNTQSMPGCRLAGFLNKSAADEAMCDLKNGKIMILLSFAVLSR